MAKQFIYKSAGKTVTYEGWDHNILGRPKFVALIRDEDSIDVLAVDDPSKLDGVVAYIDDHPETELLGIWIRRQPVTREASIDQLATCFATSQTNARQIGSHLKATISQEDYDKLIELLK